MTSNTEEKYKIHVSNSIYTSISQNYNRWWQRDYCWKIRLLTIFSTCNQYVHISTGTLCYHYLIQHHYNVSVWRHISGKKNDDVKVLHSSLTNGKDAENTPVKLHTHFIKHQHGIHSGVIKLTYTRRILPGTSEPSRVSLHWGYTWATVSLGDINTKTWSSRLWGSMQG
jgi:hypothetical protein